MNRQERTAAEASTDFLYAGRGFLRQAVGIAPYPANQAVFCDGFESGDMSAGEDAGLPSISTVSVSSVADGQFP